MLSIAMNVTVVLPRLWFLDGGRVCGFKRVGSRPPGAGSDSQVGRSVIATF